MKKTKKALAALLCLLLTALTCSALGEVPDEALHEAILSLTWPDDGGECWAEGHVVLGREETADSETVYVQACVQNFGFLAGIFTDSGGGFVMPLRIVFDKTETGWAKREIMQPEDGERYEPSLREMMPAECLRALETRGSENRVQMQRQMYAQAQAYLDAIGRGEAVGDWREKELQIADLLTVASNLTLCFSPPYPLWVTNAERLENGERFVYTREWTPDPDSPDGVAYTAPDGNTLLCGGRTGVETLTKARASDGQVIETVVIRAALYELTVTFTDAYGEKEYRFAFDGATYRRPVVTARGACRADDSQLALTAGFLPEAD